MKMTFNGRRPQKSKIGRSSHKTFENFSNFTFLQTKFMIPSTQLFPTLLQIYCKQAYSHSQREWIIATLGLSWNFSLAENLASLSLQDRPQSGIIFSLDPTHPPHILCNHLPHILCNHPPHILRNHHTHMFEIWNFSLTTVWISLFFKLRL